MVFQYPTTPKHFENYDYVPFNKAIILSRSEK